MAHDLVIWPAGQKSQIIFFCTYAPALVIHNAVSSLRNIRPQPWEDERPDKKLICHDAHCYGNVHVEMNKMKLFVKGLVPKIQMLVVLFRRSEGLHCLFYEELAHYV